MLTTALNHFGFLSITGKDAVNFLQGYTTCDLDHLSSDQAGLGAICNLKGRMVASFRVVKIENGLLLRIHRDLVNKVLSFLGKYIVFSKAEMSDMSEIYTCHGIIGEGADVQPLQINEVVKQDDSVVIKVSSCGPRFENWSLKTFDNTHVEADVQTWLQAEIKDGYAWVDPASSEEHIPQMFNYHNIGGIDFNKGCYLGQEIIARLEFRGKLKRQLHRGKSSSRVAGGDTLYSDEVKPIGTVVGIAQVNKSYSILAVVQNDSTDFVDAKLENGEPVLLSPVAVP